MSILKKIYDVLEKTNYDVYFPEQHQGECLNNYIVVKYNGAAKAVGVSTELPVYDILCYVPKTKYTDIEKMLFAVKNEMKKLYPMIRYTGNETNPYYDEDVKGHMVSLQYVGQRRIMNF